MNEWGQASLLTQPDASGISDTRQSWPSGTLSL